MKISMKQKLKNLNPLTEDYQYKKITKDYGIIVNGIGYQDAKIVRRVMAATNVPDEKPILTYLKNYLKLARDEDSLSPKKTLVLYMSGFKEFKSADGTLGIDLDAFFFNVPLVALHRLTANILLYVFKVSVIELSNPDSIHAKIEQIIKLGETDVR